MKKSIYILFIVCLAGLFSCVSEATTTTPVVELVEVGNLIPKFSVLDSNGAEVEFSFTSLKYRRVLIVFFATTCPHCQDELPKIQEAWNLLKNEGLELILVAREQDAETVADYWAEAGFTMPWYIDPDRSAFSKFASATVPRLYLVDDGTVKWKAVEHLNMATGAQLAAKITETIGRAVGVGAEVPSFTVKNSGGTDQNFTVADFTGKKSLIVFFVTTCEHCATEMPKVQAAWTALKGEGLQLITIARGESVPIVAAHWQQTGFDMPWFADPGKSAFNKFANKYVPRFYLVNEQGVVVWTAVEYLNMDQDQLIATIKTKLEI